MSSGCRLATLVMSGAVCAMTLGAGMILAASPVSGLIEDKPALELAQILRPPQEKEPRLRRQPRECSDRCHIIYVVCLRSPRKTDGHRFCNARRQHCIVRCRSGGG
jgi:hypothetical protein